MKRLIPSLVVAFAATHGVPVFADGQLDPWFSDDGMRTAIDTTGSPVAVDIAPHPDGGYRLVGHLDLSARGANRDLVVVAIEEQGDNDVSFGFLGYAFLPFDLVPDGSDFAAAVLVQEDGRTVFAGDVERSTGRDLLVGRLLAEGSLDTTFSGDGWATVEFDLGGSDIDFGSDIIQLSDGKLLLSGLVQVGATDYHCGLTRLNSNGVRDVTFDNDGRLVLDAGQGASGTFVCREMVQLDDGKILLAGAVAPDSNVNIGQIALVRINGDGSLDTGFGTNGVSLFDFDANALDVTLSLALDAGGRIFAGGYSVATSADILVVGFNANGILRPGFGNGGAVLIPLDQGGNQNDRATRIMVDRRGFIVVAGFTETASGLIPLIVRLLPSGALDSAFGTGGFMMYPTDPAFGQPNGGIISGLFEDAVGRYVAAGESSPIDGGFVLRALADAIFIGRFE